MNKEEKELLLKDLCARLPYMVKFHYTKHPQSNVDKDYDGTAIGYYCNLIVSANDKDFCADRCKLYLRPMPSMTEEESKEFALLQTDFYTDGFLYPVAAGNMINWLIAHHFDYQNLIPKGLALEAPKDMYKKL